MDGTQVDDDVKEKLVVQFCALTGASEQVGRTKLEATNWNIDLAVFDPEVNFNTDLPVAIKDSHHGPLSSSEIDDENFSPAVVTKCTNLMEDPPIGLKPDQASRTRSVFDRMNNSTARAPWVLFWLCWAGFLQGFIVNGMVNVVITTIEKRYQMRSTESGLIAGGYDVASFLFLIPVSYFGGTRSKPKFVGIGVLILAFGALVFSSPYFFSGKYDYYVEEDQLCPQNATTCKGTGSGKASLNNYKYLFFLGQFLHGAGAAPFYTLGCAYIEESVDTRTSAYYMGIFYTMALVGPAVGYVVGGQFLRLYVDWIYVNPNDIGLNTLSSIWVGCWWIGPLLGAVIAVFVAFPIMSFPRQLPGSEEIKARKVPELHKNSQNTDATKEDFGRTLADLPKSLKILITNPTFMFLNLSGAMEGLLLSGLGTFLPKVLEQQFGLTSTKAAVLMGLTTLPGGGGGTFLGGYLVKRFDLKCAGILKMCVAFSTISLLLGSSFFISCPTRKFAGVTHFTNSNNASQSESFSSMSCNSHCSCSKYHYDPICGKDNVIYYSACHAGCLNKTLNGDTTVYSECSCLKNATRSQLFPYETLTVNGDTFKVDAVRQACENECSKLPWFLFFVFVSMLFTFLVSMPSLSATLRCVAESQKSFALGIQWLGVRALGTIPAPFILGFFIDRSCILWQNSCDSNSGACLIYNNDDLSTYMVKILMTVKLISLLSFIFAGIFYKPPVLVVDSHDEQTKL
ncbi:Solute carrier organic anion transporter family member 4A1 [Halotydeus destructor]|nr:Solute carrier organic anion transporter family member 4A1 [Halotydeus destructor]